MKTKCSWCGVDMEDKDGPEGEISHGICQNCYTTEIAKVRAMLKPLTDILGKSPGMRAALGKEAVNG